MKIVKAMGYKDGDYIQLANQWAKVIIARLNMSLTNAPVWTYEVSGDILDNRKAAKGFPTPDAALAYALESLAAYREGSPNQ